MRLFGLLLVLGFAVCLGCQQKASSIPETEHVKHVDEASFQKEVLDSPVPVLVDFYADWCGPCQMQAPLLEEIASKTPDVRIAKVNVDTSPELAARYQIRSIPSLKVFRGGKVVAQHVGLADRSQLESLLSQ